MDDARVSSPDTYPAGTRWRRIGVTGRARRSRPRASRRLGRRSDPIDDHLAGADGPAASTAPSSTRCGRRSSSRRSLPLAGSVSEPLTQHGIAASAGDGAQLHRRREVGAAAPAQTAALDARSAPRTPVRQRPVDASWRTIDIGPGDPSRPEQRGSARGGEIRARLMRVWRGARRTRLRSADLSAGWPEDPPAGLIPSPEPPPPSRSAR